MNCPAPPAAEGELTPRQLEILALLKAGKANKDIAYELGIGIGTVKQHVVALFKKLKVTNRAMAVGKGYQLAGRVAPAADEVAVGDAVDSALELRPACVLSLATAGAAETAAADWRVLQNAIAVSAEEDTTLVAHPGRGIDVIFGLHRVREDDAERALKMARAIATVVADKVPLRAGLGSGHLVASIERRGGWTGETVAGRLIGDARALRDSAAPGTIMLDGAARRMIAFAQRAEGEPPPEDDGVAKLPLQAGARRRRASVHPALVGRTAEMAALQRQFEDVRLGFGRLAWLEGEAGMGKTTLGHAVADYARAAGVRWIECRCEAEDGDLPLALLEACGQRTRQTAPPIEQVVTALRAAVQSRPFGLMVDDVHLARPRDAALLVAVAGLLGELPIFLLAVGRSLKPQQLRELPGNETVKLGRLTPEDIQALVRSECRGGLPPRVLGDIVRLAQGVPLFAAELTREAIRARDSLEPRMPLTLSALVMSRLETMSLDRALLRLAALREPATATALRGTWPGTPDALEAEIERAVANGILICDTGPGGETIRFAHPMVHAVIKHLLLAGRADVDAGRTAAALA